MNSIKEPLVSVVVFTYNSSQTVMETLNSIKNQSYKNLELIITDDASKDDTIRVCEEWLKENSDRFLFTQLITTEKNTGISANANRGCFASNGEWIKIIAGDDRLLPNCVASFVDFISYNLGVDVVFSKIVGFGDLDSKAAKKCWWMDCGQVFKLLSKREFMTVLCFRNFLPAASAFFKKSVFVALGGYDETIPFIEDWPFWIKVLRNGYSMGFNNEVTVEYRFSNQSISQKGKANTNSLFNESSEKATGYAHSCLSELGAGAHFYKITTYNSFTYNSLLWKITHCLNLFNPFFYYKNKVFRKLEGIIK